MRHPLLAVSVALAILLGVSPAARAETVTSNPTPLTLSTTGAVPGCPTLDEVDGTLVADKVRKLLRRADTVDADQDEVGFYASLLYAVLQLNPAATVAVCDPDIAAAGRPLASLAGTAVDAPTADLVGFGFRSRGAPAADPGSAARVGDRYALPAVGPRATIALAVRTPSGAATFTVGPFESAPTEVRIEGTAAAPVAAVALASGTTVTQAVQAPAAVRTTISARPLRGRALSGVVAFEVRGAPGAIVATADPDAEDPGDIFGDPGSYFVADRSGRASGRLVPDPDAKTIAFSVLDPSRRTLLTSTCSYRRARGTLRSVRCAPVRAASGTTTPTTFGARRLGPTPPSAGPRSEHPSVPVAGGARALPTVGAELTTVDRVPRNEQLGFDGLVEIRPLLGDINGDGRPDLGTGDPLTGQSLALSTPTGWAKVPVEASFPDELSATPDVNGDGVDELVLRLEEHRIYAGNAAWSAAPPASLAFGERVPLGPADLQLTAGLDGFDGGQIFGLPDATGDGRPELGVPSTSGNGLGVFASEPLALGTKHTVPVLQTSAVRDDIDGLDAFETLFGGVDDDEETQVAPGLAEAALFPVSTLLPVRGGALASEVALEVDPASGRASSTVAFRRLGLTPPWSFSTVGTPVVVAGVATVTDFDPASGDLLLRTTDEGCDRRGRCVVRLRRIDGAGRIASTVSIRTDARSLDAAFTGDGPDADTRLDVLIHDDEYGGDRGPAVPGLRGTIAVWPSASPASVALSGLPVLGRGAAPLTVGGPLSHWTAPDGRRFHAGHAVGGTQRRPTEQLTLIGALR